MPDLFGLIITDVLIHVIEKNIPIDNALNLINFTDFMPFSCRKKSKLVLKFKSEEIIRTLKSSYKTSKGKSDLGKMEFVRLVLDGNLFKPTMGLETYAVTFYT